MNRDTTSLSDAAWELSTATAALWLRFKDQMPPELQEDLKRRIDTVQSLVKQAGDRQADT